jgi:hypothetical protein
METPSCTTVFLLPVSTDTAWFAMIYDYEKRMAKANCEIRFCKKRLKYKPAKRCAVFPSCIVIIRNRDWTGYLQTSTDLRNLLQARSEFEFPPTLTQAKIPENWTKSITSLLDLNALLQERMWL